jgi:hypothetical protein
VAQGRWVRPAVAQGGVGQARPVRGGRRRPAPMRGGQRRCEASGGGWHLQRQHGWGEEAGAGRVGPSAEVSEV